MFRRDEYDRLIKDFFGDTTTEARTNAVARGRIFSRHAGLKELRAALETDLDPEGRPGRHQARRDVRQRALAARAMTAAYRWCVLYVDNPDPATLVPVVADLLGPADYLDVFRVPGFTVDVRRNPDRTRGPHHLDWPSTVDIRMSKYQKLRTK